MRMALKDGQLYIIEANSTQHSIIRSWNKMRWDKYRQQFSGRADRELLNKLAGIVRLPEPVETERQRLNRIQEAVDAERMNEHPVPLYKYPVKLKMFDHQVRGANMALLTFGLVSPQEDKNGKDGS